jgi:type IV secretion system protein VirB9
MNHIGKCSLAVCLLIAGVAGANEEPQTLRTAQPPAGMVPNIPPELEIPPEYLPRIEAAATDKPAVPATTPTAQASEGSPSPSGDAGDEDCEVADCTRSDVTTIVLPKKKNPSAIALGRPAQQAIAESHEWAENPAALPVRDAGGRMLFPFGESIPTIVCAPLRVCDIQLQKGETVLGKPHIGDAIRWKVSHAISGSGDQQVTHLIVKPTEEGLDTNLIVPTDRHTYHLRLVSSVNQYVASVAFEYPDDEPEDWNSIPGSSRNALLTKGDMPNVAVERLNFNYKIEVVKGKPSFKPLRAMDDGYHTYIAMNEEMALAESPVLIGISPSGEEQMINYRLKGNMYVVDGTLDRLALISGVGRKQQRIELTRVVCKRGWLSKCPGAQE